MPALGPLILRRAGIAPGDPVPFADTAQHRAAFVAWLHHVAGDGIGTDAAARPQAELIAGFAEVAVPDQILRMDRIARDLSALSRAMDLPDPGWVQPEPDPILMGLAAIRDAELEAEAARLLWRDMRAFGFGRWGGPQAA
jgi:hypothetical protein